MIIKTVHRSTAGWRSIGNSRKYYRSIWEANYARYLQFLLDKGDLIEWAHEPKTFWFEGIKRGVTNYKPDFFVKERNGTTYWVEVKGYMDAKSKTKLDRMKKYFPEEEVRVVDKTFFKKNFILPVIITGWERG